MRQMCCEISPWKIIWSSSQRNPQPLQREPQELPSSEARKASAGARPWGSDCALVYLQTCFSFPPLFSPQLCPPGSPGHPSCLSQGRRRDTNEKERLLTPWLPHQPRQRDPDACPQRVSAPGGRWVDLRPSSGPLQQKSVGRRLRRESLRLPRKENDPLGWVSPVKCIP